MVNRALLVLCISLVAFSAGFRAVGAAKKPRKKEPVSQCYLHGIVRAKDESKKPELSDMIRMRFDADSRDKCKRMLDAYCRYNIRDKGYLASTLVGSWRDDVDDTANTVSFQFTDKCQVSASDDN